MNPLRYILVGIVLISLTFLVVGKLQAQEIIAAPKDCPPSDGYEWSKFADHPTGKVMWVQARTMQQFERLCGKAGACALRFEELTVVVALNPPWTYSESFKIHEGCHDGWDHTRQAFGSLLR